jgi:hypothetical protein
MFERVGPWCLAISLAAASMSPSGRATAGDLPDAPRKGRAANPEVDGTHAVPLSVQQLRDIATKGVPAALDPVAPAREKNPRLTPRATPETGAVREAHRAGIKRRSLISPAIGDIPRREWSEPWNARKAQDLILRNGRLEAVSPRPALSTSRPR